MTCLAQSTDTATNAHDRAANHSEVAIERARTDSMHVARCVANDAIMSTTNALC